MPTLLLLSAKLTESKNNFLVGDKGQRSQQRSQKLIKLPPSAKGLGCHYRQMRRDQTYTFLILVWPFPEGGWT